MLQFCKNNPNIVFIFFIFSYFFLNRYEEISFFKPYSVHQWRQADCYSIASNYYENNLPFLEPSIHQIGYSNNGKTISEFPIIYYSVSKLWRLFGKHAVIYRLLNFLIFQDIVAVHGSILNSIDCLFNILFV